MSFPIQPCHICGVVPDARVAESDGRPLCWTHWGDIYDKRRIREASQRALLPVPSPDHQKLRGCLSSLGELAQRGAESLGDIGAHAADERALLDGIGRLFAEIEQVECKRDKYRDSYEKSKAKVERLLAMRAPNESEVLRILRSLPEDEANAIDCALGAVASMADRVVEKAHTDRDSALAGWGRLLDELDGTLIDIDDGRYEEKLAEWNAFKVANRAEFEELKA